MSDQPTTNPGPRLPWRERHEDHAWQKQGPFEWCPRCGSLKDGLGIVVAAIAEFHGASITKCVITRTA